MPLTFRPTTLQKSAAFARLADWSVFEDGRRAAPKPPAVAGTPYSNLRELLRERRSVAKIAEHRRH
jgi:hypothetical protein